jgi:hypothetical protein
MLNKWLKDELKRIDKKNHSLKYYTSIWLGWPRKTIKDLSKHSWCPNWDSNWEPSEYMPNVILLCQLPLRKTIKNSV